MHYNLDLSSCHLLCSLLNQQLTPTKDFKHTGAEFNIKDNKSVAVIRQITAGRVILQRGRMSPMRRMRGAVQDAATCRHRTPADSGQRTVRCVRI